MTYINLLVVGDSEVRMFCEGHDHLRLNYGVNVQTEYRSGGTLEDCVGQIRKRMKPTTQVLIVWALTPYAWRRTPLSVPGKRDITIFRPSLHIPMEKIPKRMDDIMKEVSFINPKCDVYLALPAIKDMYRFNQTRLVRAWGNKYTDFLLNHPDYNPTQMRKHAVNTYNGFHSLGKSHYWWNEKKVLYGNGALNCYTHKRPSSKKYMKKGIAHNDYLSGKTVHLNSELLPDGLHGNQLFLRYYVQNNKRIFDPFRSPSTRPEQKKKSLLGDYPGSSELFYKEPIRIVTMEKDQPENVPDRVSEYLYRFDNLSQPSTSRSGRVSGPHPITVTSMERNSVQPTIRQHATHYPTCIESSFLPFTNQSPFPTSSIPSIIVEENLNIDAHMTVRGYMNDRIRSGRGEKRKQIEDLDELIRIAKIEKEILKRQRK